MAPALFKQVIDHLINIGIIDVPGGTGNPPDIALYSWGEPLLHPKINDIFRILNDNRFKAAISANLGHMPDIEDELLPVISNFTLSLSGFTQDSYGKIHGQPLQKVLDNFDRVYESLRKHAPETVIKISWHEYRFNQHEFWDAHKFFDRPGISIEPVVAFFNDGRLMVDFLQDKMSPEYLAEANKNIDLDRMRRRGSHHRNKSGDYYCKQWDQLMVDELGRLLTCCIFSGYDPGIALGNILELSADEIWARKRKASACGECVSSGAARFIHKLDTSLPAGGGMYGLKLRARNIGESLQRKLSFAYVRRKMSKLLSSGSRKIA